MENFVKKITSYQFFNNLYPGALLWFVICNLFHIQFNCGDFVIVFFVCYFLGMVSSRVGSLVVEPIAKCFVRWSDKGDYVRASERDSSISTLMQEANTYRTLAALGLLVTFILVACSVPDVWSVVLDFRMTACDYNIVPFCTGFLFENAGLILGGIWVTILFVLSYIKQLRHIQQRIELASCNKT